MNMFPKSAKPYLRQLRYWLKSNEPAIKLTRERDDLIKKYRNIKINKLKSKNSKKILFVSGYGIGTSYSVIEPIIMLALMARGHDIENVYCNKGLSACEFNPVGNNTPTADAEYLQGLFRDAINEKCNFCKNNVEAMNNYLDIPLHSIKSNLDEKDYQISKNYISENYSTEINYKDYCYEGVNIGEDAYASILRVTYLGKIPSGEIGEQLKKRYLISGVQTVIAYKKIFSLSNPDRIVCIHGIYQTHGLVVKVAKFLNIPVIVIGGGGIRKNTVLACHGETYHHQLINEDNSIWLKNKFDKQKESKVLEYLNAKRYNGLSVDNLNYHPNPKNDIDEILKELNIDRKRAIITIYTNVIWDAQIIYKSNVFKDIYEWVQDTIKLLENQNIWLLIRVHPAEVKGGNPSKEKMVDELKKIFIKLPHNVIVIPPESNISSYTLAEISKLNIIYGTKMGLEMALMKRPVMVCGESFSRNKGFCIDIESKDDYFNQLSDVINKDFEINLNIKYTLAVRFAYYIYFQKMIDLPISTNKLMSSDYSSNLNFDSFIELIDKKLHPGLDSLCNGIINLTPLNHD